jgi:hypothetical protein
MSLINAIKSRNVQDLANEGLRVAYTGEILVGPATDQQVPGSAIVAERFYIVTGWHLSTSSATPVKVTLGFKKAGDPTVPFFTAYITANSPAEKVLPVHDWKFGDLEYELVITTSAAADVAYSVDARISASKEPKGYVEREGNKTHDTKGNFPPESSLHRGHPY